MINDVHIEKTSNGGYLVVRTISGNQKERITCDTYAKARKLLQRYVELNGRRTLLLCTIGINYE